ncbi:MAG: GEGP motif-containing diheme protein [bacterium]
MRKKFIVMSILAILALTSSIAFPAYHHMGEKDSDKFLAVYPDKTGTKLDHCALCHSGGQYEKKGQMVNLGSCQWCHYSYGYNGSGNILHTMNAYGKAYHDNGRNSNAIKAIENLDSDGDGFTNKEEIAADRFPGDAADDPTKKVAPFRVYTKAQLEAMPQHTQFLLMNTSRSGDFYAEYSGVPMEDLLHDAGMLNTATGIKIYAPDGWLNYYPLEYDPDPELYHVKGTYPSSIFQYNSEADAAFGGWCDYSAFSCIGRNHNDPIFVKDGLKMILAIKRDGAYLTPGILTNENKLDGEGPYRLVPPQKIPSPPDQSSTSGNQNVIWPYDYDWDHNAGSSARSVTIIKVEPLPEGTTDIDILEAGWNYVDQGKIIIYGAIEDVNPPTNTNPPTTCNRDLNGDGKVTPNDAQLAFRCYLNAATCSYCADINGDGIVTPSDALCLFQNYLGQPSCLD